MLRHLPFGVVVIDRNYRILSVNGGARRLLGIRDIANDQDFLHAVRGLPYAQVRGAIDVTFREHAPVSLDELELDPPVGGDGRFVNMTVMPMQLDATAPELAVVCVSDATDVVQTRRRLDAVGAEQTQLVDDLSTANKRFSDMNKVLQDANEELQAANEELMLTQEELQATNEEFEATNEELQATNEELETNNEELQATNEELQTTNDELTARTAELQELTRAVTDERTRLEEIIKLAPFYVLLLKGPALIVEAHNPRYERLLGERNVAGRPFEEVFVGRENKVFVQAVRDAYRQDAIGTARTPFLLPAEGDEKTAVQFVHSIVPVHDAAGRVDGVFIYTERDAGGPDGDGEAPGGG